MLKYTSSTGTSLYFTSKAFTYPQYSTVYESTKNKAVLQFYNCFITLAWNVQKQFNEFTFLLNINAYYVEKIILTILPRLHNIDTFYVEKIHLTILPQLHLLDYTFLGDSLYNVQQSYLLQSIECHTTSHCLYQSWHSSRPLFRSTYLAYGCNKMIPLPRIEPKAFQSCSTVVNWTILTPDYITSLT